MTATTHRAQRAARRFLSALVVAALLGPSLPGTAVADPVRRLGTVQAATANTVLDQFDQQMLDLMNGARATAGAPALTAAPGLGTLALGWSTFMANGGTGGVLQHNPNVRAQLPSNGAASATAWAENVASWSPGTGRDAASVFGLYMNSPGHKANILNPNLLFVGTGTVINGANVGFNTQNFTNRIDQTAPPAALPIGHVDSMTVVGTTVVVRGWADDPADSSLSSTAMITVGTVSRVVTANWPRADVNAAQSITGQHGLKKTMSIGVGTTRVCVTALSISGALRTSLGCFDVSRT